MKEIDLIFHKYDAETATDSIFTDLGLDALEKTVFEKDALLFSIFKEIISTPLVKKEEILERQNILKDFLKYPDFVNELNDMCVSAPERRIPPLRSIYSSITPREKLAEYLDTTDKAIAITTDLNEIFEGKQFASSLLSDFQSQLANHKQYEDFKAQLNKMSHYWTDGDMTLAVEYLDTFKFKHATLESTEAKIPSDLKKAFSIKGLFSKGQADDSIQYGESVLKYVYDEVYKSTTLNICSMISHINAHILTVCEHLAKQTAFYMASMKIIDYLKQNNYPYSFPEFTNGGAIRTKGIIDLSLAVQTDRDKIIDNNLDDKNGNVLVITGPNQGGKTSFLKALGIAQLFAQGGIIVPAESYTSPVYKGIVTHFPREEDSALNFGKLAEELTRLRVDFPKLVNGGLMLMNESFATTTEHEGCDIARDVIRACTKSGSTVIFVTHFHDIPNNIDELNSQLFNGAKAISMIATFAKNDGKIEYSYKIEEGKPQPHIFAMEFLKK